MVQRGHAFAIVDEVDSILVDEARTPLIISGPRTTSPSSTMPIDKLLPHLEAEDYDLDEKQRTVNLTEAGNEHMEQLLREARHARRRGRLALRRGQCDDRPPRQPGFARA